VEELSGTRLPLDEAGFITMHLVNAGLTGGMATTLKTAEALRGAMAIVRESLPGALSEDSIHYARFLTHLKFVIQRISDHAQLTGGHEELYQMLLRSDPESFATAERIAEYLARTYQVQLSQEEVLYLVIHVARLRHAEDAERAD